jgi:hypothetical protein
VSVKNVLIIDNDLGFVFWLGQALDAAGYETLPAKGITEAVSLLAELKVRIDVLIVRCTLNGAGDFARAFRASQKGYLKTIALVDETDGHGERMKDWDGWQLKPRMPDILARNTFLSLVQGVLSLDTPVPRT